MSGITVEWALAQLTTALSVLGRWVDESVVESVG